MDVVFTGVCVMDCQADRCVFDTGIFGLVESVLAAVIGPVSAVSGRLCLWVCVSVGLRGGGGVYIRGGGLYGRGVCMGGGGENHMY